MTTLKMVINTESLIDALEDIVMGKFEKEYVPVMFERFSKGDILKEGNVFVKAGRIYKLLDALRKMDEQPLKVEFSEECIQLDHVQF